MSTFPITRLSVSDLRTTRVPLAPAASRTQNSSGDFGMLPAFSGAGVPTLAISGTPFGSGGGISDGWGAIGANCGIGDNFSMLIGRHNLKSLVATKMERGLLCLSRMHLPQSVLLATMLVWCMCASGQASTTPPRPRVYFSDTSRIGKPFAKDPSVIRFHGSYWMYYSIPAAPSHSAAAATGGRGWGIGIARSSNLIHWTKEGELAPMQPIEKDGIAAPGARVIRGKVHLFYQTYGKGRQDSICHAVSMDAVHFEHDPTNPIYRPADAAWSAGRAIDAEVYPHGKELWMFFATRDPEMKIQQIGMAKAPLESGFERTAWHTVSLQGPVLKPDLAWEGKCVEAPSVLYRNGRYYLFYAGNYNNAPQQIGVATSITGERWTKLIQEPLLANGAPGSWNSSESGHPGVFTDDNGRTYLFFQGNNDGGETWWISVMEIRWHGIMPYLVDINSSGVKRHIAKRSPVGAD